MFLWKMNFKRLTREQIGNKAERKKDEKMMNMIQKTSRQPTMNYDELLISN